MSVPLTPRAPLTARSLFAAGQSSELVRRRASQSGQKTSFRPCLAGSAGSVWTKSIISTVALCHGSCLKPCTYAGARRRRHTGRGTRECVVSVRNPDSEIREYTTFQCRVHMWSTIRIGSRIYPVPSRLIRREGAVIPRASTGRAA